MAISLEEVIKTLQLLHDYHLGRKIISWAEHREMLGLLKNTLKGLLKVKDGAFRGIYGKPTLSKKPKKGKL